MWALSFLPNIFFHLMLAVGVICLVISFVLRMFPFVEQYRTPMQLVGILLTALGIWYEGGIAKDKEYISKIVGLEQKLAVAEEKSNSVNTIIEERVVTKTKIIKEKVYVNRNVIKEVVGQQVDAMCTLPKSAIVLHNSASLNEVARGPEASDGTPSGVKASELLDTVVVNYGSCHENTNRLIEWQNWYRAQKEIFDSLK